MADAIATEPQEPEQETTVEEPLVEEDNLRGHAPPPPEERYS